MQDVVELWKNMVEKKKILLIAPFWNKSNHVGVYRIDRFKRWLAASGYRIIIVSSGNDEIQSYDWGKVISIKNHIDNITTKLISLHQKIKTKIPLYIWNTLTSIFLIPDSNIFWARKIIKHPVVKKEIKDVKLILSSSPPNSSHIACFKLAKQLNVPFIVDMRDGWLDEPLIRYLRISKIRRAIERRQEKKVLTASSKIFVSSNEWKKALVNRLPLLKNKIDVLTNAYPLHVFIENESSENEDKTTLNLLHAGKFTGSSYLRTVDTLLKPIYNVLKNINSKVGIKFHFIGEIRRKDMKVLNEWIKLFGKYKSEIIIRDSMTRDDLFKLFNQMDGLLLLSTSRSAIPSKLFEYVKSGKPIFAVTAKGSAVWNLAQNIPQMFLFDYTPNSEDYSSVKNFLQACKAGNYKVNVPVEYSEEYLSEKFIKAVKEIVK